MRETKLFELVTGTEMKPWLKRNMLPNINTCENGWSNFSANLRDVSLKLLELTQFAWPHLSIYINFLCVVKNYSRTSSRVLVFWWGHLLSLWIHPMREKVKINHCTIFCNPHNTFTHHTPTHHSSSPPTLNTTPSRPTHRHTSAPHSLKYNTFTHHTPTHRHTTAPHPLHPHHA